MNKKVAVLALSVAFAVTLAGRAFADNGQNQNSFGDLSPNTSQYSNNDAYSHNNTDTGNVQPFDSFNNESTNDSGNVSVPITNSANDNSFHSKDSHDDNSVNQAASGQVNLNDSYAGDINAADNSSTIFDGDVNLASFGYGYGGGNINTGIMSDSIQGDYSAQFKNVGVGLNNATVTSSSLNSNQTSNINVLSP